MTAAVVTVLMLLVVGVFTAGFSRALDQRHDAELQRDLERRQVEYMRWLLSVDHLRRIEDSRPVEPAAPSADEVLWDDVLTDEQRAWFQANLWGGPRVGVLSALPALPSVHE